MVAGEEPARLPRSFCGLAGGSLSELAAVLVEFGEDLHADSGLWRSLESYRNRYPTLSLVQGGES